MSNARPARTGPEGCGSTIRVGTWNLWWRFGDWRARADAIGAVLAREGLDVCGLQEVWAAGDRNFAGELATRLGMSWAWMPSPESGRWCAKLGERGVEFGNAVLSRWPILDQSVLHLPAGDAEPEGRTAVYALIDLPGGPLPFFTAQLNSSPGQSAIRCAQVRALTSFIAAKSGGFPMPPVLTGDLNAASESDEIRLLGGHLTAPHVPGQVLIDAWLYADQPDSGWTWNRANPHVAATLEPSARIDYVFAGIPRRPPAGAIIGVQLFGADPVDGVWPSDHAGVAAEVESPRPNRSDGR